MLTAIKDGIQLIIGFFQSLFSFVGSLFSGLANLVKMIPQTMESITLFNFMFPSWVWIPLVSALGLAVFLALLKWIKGIL